MRKISELLEYIEPSTVTRSVLRPGLSQSEYDAGLNEAEDKIEYQARCLYENGWTAEMEGRYQSSARGCNFILPDGDALIIALERMPAIAAEEERAREIRRERNEEILRLAKEKERQARLRKFQNEPQKNQAPAEQVFDKQEDDLEFKL